MQKKKEKIKIQGKNYKVEKPVSETLKALADALHSHEVALMTWVHKDYIGKKFTGDDLPPKIIYTSRSHGWSTTLLKDRIAKQTIIQNIDILGDLGINVHSKNKDKKDK